MFRDPKAMGGEGLVGGKGKAMGGGSWLLISL